jgi:hypothetical protein
MERLAGTVTLESVSSDRTEDLFSYFQQFVPSDLHIRLGHGTRRRAGTAALRDRNLLCLDTHRQYREGHDGAGK